MPVRLFRDVKRCRQQVFQKYRVRTVDRDLGSNVNFVTNWLYQVSRDYVTPLQSLLLICTQCGTKGWLQPYVTPQQKNDSSRHDIIYRNIETLYSKTCCFLSRCQISKISPISQKDDGVKGAVTVLESITTHSILASVFSVHIVRQSCYVHRTHQLYNISRKYIHDIVVYRLNYLFITGS